MSLPANEDAALKAIPALEKVWSQRWSEWRRAHADLLVHGKRLHEYFCESSSLDIKLDELGAAYNSVRASSQSQRFALTKKGSVGWVLDDTAGGDEEQVQRGDLFCAVFGCSIPVVMQPHGDGYLVLGEGYLQGFMEGEALDPAKYEGLQDQDFKIC